MEYVKEAEVVIDSDTGDWFKAYAHPENWTVKIIFESLLNARNAGKRKGFWRLHYFDLPVFKEKLNNAGIMDRGITDEAFQQLEVVQARFDELERMKSGEYNKDLEFLGGLLKTNLYKDQMSGVRFLSAQFASGCFDEMGLGKTLECLATFIVWKHLGLADTALVITKNDVKKGWAKQVALHTHLSCTVLGNGTNNCLVGLAEYRANPTNILVVNFESLIDRKEKKKKPEENEEVVRGKSRIKQEIIDLGFDLVVIDEFHLAKNEEALRSQAIREILESTVPSERNLKLVTVELEDGRQVQRIVTIDQVRYSLGQNADLEVGV